MNSPILAIGHNNFVNPFGVLSLESEVLATADKIHLFKDSGIQQNTLDTLWVNSHTKFTKKALYDIRRSRQEFYVLHENQVYHAMTMAESDVSKAAIGYPRIIV